MNSNQRIPLLLIIAFGVALGQVVLETAQMATRDLIRPLIHGVLGKVFNGMDSEYFKLGSFLSDAISMAVVVVILWFVWQKVAEPMIKKGSSEEPKP